MAYFQELKMEYQKFTRELSSWHAGIFSGLRAKDPTANTQIREVIERMCILENPDQFGMSYPKDDVAGRVKAIIDDIIEKDKTLSGPSRTLLQEAAEAIWQRSQGVVSGQRL